MDASTVWIVKVVPDEPAIAVAELGVMVIWFAAGGVQALVYSG